MFWSNFEYFLGIYHGSISMVLRFGSYLRSLIKTVFSLDVRALAALRIGIAIILIVDLLVVVGDLRALHTDKGIMPPSVASSEYPDENSRSIHTISGRYDYQFVLFLIHLTLAVLLLVGYKSRTVIVLTWFMTCSLQGANPIILNSGDTILRMTLFWMMFLPIADRRSIDRAGQQIDTTRQTHFSAATVALIVQMGIIYIVSAYLKTDAMRTSEFTATYYTLSLEIFKKPLGELLYQHYDLMIMLTAYVFYLEKFGAYLYLLPRKSNWWKTLTCFLFITFHLGLALTMYIGHFPWTAMVAWMALLPSPIWNRLEKSRPFQYVATRLQQLSRPQTTQPPFRLARGWQIFVVVLIGYVVSWNIRTTDFAKHSKWFPYEINRFAFLLRIDQHRNMFAPYPMTDDGWYVIVGTQANGQQVDLLRDNKIVDYKKPSKVARQWPHEKRRKYGTNIRQRSNHHLRQYYLSYLCEHHNQKASEYQQLISIQMYYMLEETLDHYETAPVEKVLLDSIECQSK